MDHSAINMSYTIVRCWLWAALFAVCLGPRMAMALKIDALCNDAVFYIDLAEGYERGDERAGLGRLGLNTYPPILAGVHRLGLSWQNASEFWGVMVASLAVLPLYGWVRRQFDDRSALVAALLYAFHPKLIEWSPELLRDPTFWLLCGLSLYFSWRAAAESRAAWFAAAGICVVLAAHTRFEGWFLYLPLAGWTVLGAGPEKAWRRKFGGLALSLGMCPLLLLAVNITMLRNHDRWELGNFDRLQYVAQWWQATWPGHEKREPAQSDATGPTASGTPQSSERVPLKNLVMLFGNTFRRGFGGFFGIAWLIGFAAARRRLLRADYRLLFLVACCVFAAAWVHCWYAQATSSRYFLLIVLLALPCSATGWLWAYDRAVRLAETIVHPRRFRPAIVTTSLIATALVGVSESLADRHDGRSRDAALGEWLLEELGPRSRVATVGPMPLVGFYAHTRANAITANDARLLEPAPSQPQAIVAARRRTSAASLDEILCSASARGYRSVDAARLPAGYNWSDVIVLIASAGDER